MVSDLTRFLFLPNAFTMNLGGEILSLGYLFLCSINLSRSSALCSLDMTPAEFPKSWNSA